MKTLGGTPHLRRSKRFKRGYKMADKTPDMATGKYRSRGNLTISGPYLTPPKRAQTTHLIPRPKRGIADATPLTSQALLATTPPKRGVFRRLKRLLTPRRARGKLTLLSTPVGGRPEEIEGASDAPVTELGADTSVWSMSRDVTFSSSTSPCSCASSSRSSSSRNSSCSELPPPLPPPTIIQPQPSTAFLSHIVGELQSGEIQPLNSTLQYPLHSTLRSQSKLLDVNGNRAIDTCSQCTTLHLRMRTTQPSCLLAKLGKRPEPIGASSSELCRLAMATK